MRLEYDAVCFDLYGTLLDASGGACDGARALLGGLGGARWAIVTSCPRRLAEALIGEARFPPVPVLVTADDVVRNKPAPDGYRLAAERLSARHVLAVEDSAGGVRAALAAGMDVVGVIRGRGPEVVRGATALVASIADLHLHVTDAGIVYDPS